MMPHPRPILSRRTMAGEVHGLLPVREALRRLTDEGAPVEGKWNSATRCPRSARRGMTSCARSEG